MAASVGERSMDLITASNCFAHIEDIDVILVGVECALKDDGTFIVEVHYGPNLFATGQYDFIYHEHMYYYSLRSLSALLNRHGFSMYDVDFIPTHGGSIRAFIQRSEHSPHKISDKLNKAKEEEIGGGFSKVDAYIGFRDRVHEHMSRTRNTLQEIKSRGHKIVAFGASGRANAFLNYANVDANTIDFIIDESPERAGRYVPKVMIPIKPLKGNENASFDCLFITAWNFREQILVKTKNMNFSQTLDAFPEVCISIR